jgi:O-antigen/teichoic acid export membrane protein
MLTSEHKVLRNTVYSVVSRIFADVVFLGFYILISRRFGREGIGLYSFALAFSALFFTAADYGLSQYLVKEYSRNRTQLKKQFGNLLTIKLLFSVFATGLMFLFAPLFHMGPHELQILGIVGFAQFSYRFGDFLIAVFAAHEDISKIAFSEIVLKVSIFVIGVTLFVLKVPFEMVLLSLPISGAIYIALIGFKLVREYGKFDLMPQRATLLKTLKGALPFFLITALATFYFRMNPILLNFFQSYKDCGIYAAPYKIAEIFAIFVTFFRNALFPALSRLYAESDIAHRNLYSNALRYILLIFLPISMLLFLTADKIVILLFGPEFSESAPVLQILCLFIVFSGMRQVLVATLGSIDGQWKWLASQGGGVLFGVLLGVILIPRWSYLGAAWSLVFSEIIVFLLSFQYASQKLGKLELSSILLKPVIASVLTGILILVLRNMNVMLVAPLATLFCIVCLIALGAINKQDLSFLKYSLLPRLKVNK